MLMALSPQSSKPIISTPTASAIIHPHPKALSTSPHDCSEYILCDSICKISFDSA
uniref:Uncharacterized protein n=1 Tax=Anguilla anguilla TaxID=7936 RepID=A0A0E9RV75_ANGAN